MLLENLRANHPTFFSHLETAGYSARYIGTARKLVKTILDESNAMGWESYHDVFRHYEANLGSSYGVVKHKTAIGAIMEFDLNGKFPDKSHSALAKKGAYTKLCPMFRILIDRYATAARSGGKKESSIRMESSNASSFLLRIQETGIERLEDITEEAVIAMFFSPSCSKRLGSAQRKCVSNVIRANMQFEPEGCRKALAAIPVIRKSTKNVQYINDREDRLILQVLDDMTNDLALRDRAIGKLAYFTGLRSSDIVGLDLDSIDWNDDLISIKQQKTDVPLELPLGASAGNAIFDYLVEERPSSECPALFLTKDKPYRRLQDTWSVSAGILARAGIRQSAGDRKGFHIFRHHMATSLLGNDVPQAVITEVLGHGSPNSLDIYLSADISHLRECSLSIGRFPIGEGVFADA